jgi:hypothetical protein
MVWLIKLSSETNRWDAGARDSTICAARKLLDEHLLRGQSKLAYPSLTSQKEGRPMRLSRFVAAVLSFGALSFSVPALAAEGAVLITQEAALAGNLTPGDGPDFPVTLTRSGVYVLGGNLKVTAGRSGIVVRSHDVTIDLNGFTLHGKDQAVRGIVVPGDRLNISVRNGAITRFTREGIYAPDFSVGRFEELHIYGNRGTGKILGAYVRIADSNISANLGSGLKCQAYCQLEGSVVT